MAITRIREAGFEGGSLLPEMDSACAVPGTYVASASSPKTGRYAATCNGLTSVGYFGFAGLALSQFNLGFHFCMEGVAATCPHIVQWLSASAVIGGIRVSTSHKPMIYVGTASAASSSHQLRRGKSACAYQHIGVAVNIADSGGFIDLFVDGSPIASASGDTKPSAATQIDEIRFHVQSAANNFQTPAFYDDIILDDATGEPSGCRIADRRLLFLAPCAPGASSGLEASPAGSNFRNVDDFASGSHDGDTTYVSSSATVQDAYILEDPYGIRSIDSIMGVRPAAVIKRADTTASRFVDIWFESGGASGLNNACTPGTTYQWLRGSRSTCDPATEAAWAGSAAIASLVFIQKVSLAT